MYYLLFFLDPGIERIKKHGQPSIYSSLAPLLPMGPRLGARQSVLLKMGGCVSDEETR
jgi:hypothetical protein